NSFGGFKIGASYSFGRDASPAGGFNAPGEGTCAGGVPGNNAACREWSALLQYDANNWGVATTYDRQNGGPGATAYLFNGLPTLSFTSSSNHDSRFLTDGYVKFGSFTFGAIWLNRHVEAGSTSTPGITSNQVALEAQYQITPALSVDSMVQRIVNR